MAATGEVEIPTVEKPVEEVPATEESQKVEKPIQEKKPRVRKEKKARAPKTASHPPYFQMIKEALLSLNEKSGSSPYAIAKYMDEKHKAVLPANFRKMLGLQLKNSAAKGKLIKIKASYKLSETVKGTGKAKAVAEKKPKPMAKPKAKSTAPKAGPPKTRGTKRRSVTENKKAAPKKAKKRAPAKPKQPKSIKSPVAKKAKKAAA